MRAWSRGIWTLPAASGVLLAFAYFPFGLLVPNFVAFLPILHWLEANPRVPWQERARAGLVFGLTVNVLILHWVFAMVSISWLAVVLFVFLASAFTIDVALSVTLAGWIRRRTGWSYVWVLPSCWISSEWLRTWGDLRMTADHVGHTLGGYPFLVQFADVVGPYGVGAFMLVANVLLYRAIRDRRTPGGRRAAWWLAGLVALVLGYDAWAWTHPPEATATVRAAVVQPNIPLDVKDSAGTGQEQLDVLADLTRQAADRGAELIVWPESAYPAPLIHWLDAPHTYALPPLQQLAAETGAAILTGAEYAQVRSAEDYDYYNAAVVAHPDGRLDPRWTAKVYLVPFTEKVPFEGLLGPLFHEGDGEWRWLSGAFRPGPPATPLDLGGFSVGVLVCYEELYADLSRSLRNAGAALQVIITNDAWFGRTVFQAYQANTVSLRAIENRSAFLRVANTGISGFVDPLGRYHGRTGLFVPAVDVFDVPLTSTRTVYDRTGDVVAWLAAAGFAVMAAVSIRRGWRDRRRRRHHEPEPQRPDVGTIPGPGPVADGPRDGPGGDDRGPRRDPPGDRHDRPPGDGP